MLGINVSEGRAVGWFGPGITSAIISIALLAISIIALGGLITMRVLNAVGPNTPDIPPATTPIAPTTPTSNPTPTTSEPTPLPGVIEITVEKLVSDLLTNPDKYKKGTVLQVSGMYLGERVVSYGDHSESFYLNSTVKAPAGTDLAVEIYVKTEREPELLKTFRALANGKVVVQGTYFFFSTYTSEGRNYARASLENVSLVSVTTVK